MERLKEEHLSVDLLKELFEYHEDGYLVWKHRPSSHFVEVADTNRFNTSNSGNRVGYFNKRTDSKKVGFGYWKAVISLNGKGLSKGYFKVHRLIYAIHHGYFPPIVDHKDGDTNNNCISNLREVTSQQNGWNSEKPVSNVTGYKGVSYSNAKNRVKRYRASLSRGHHNFFLGFYHTAEEAAYAFNIAVVYINPHYCRLNELPENQSFTLSGKFFNEVLPKIKDGSFDWEGA